jgi:plasmid stabilization system protein ParE
MGYEVRLTAKARGDLNEIVAYIAQDNPSAAERLGSHHHDIDPLRMARQFRFGSSIAEGHRRKVMSLEPETMRPPSALPRH